MPSIGFSDSPSILTNVKISSMVGRKQSQRRRRGPDNVDLIRVVSPKTIHARDYSSPVETPKNVKHIDLSSVLRKRLGEKNLERDSLVPKLKKNKYKPDFKRRSIGMVAQYTQPSAYSPAASLPTEGGVMAVRSRLNSRASKVRLDPDGPKFPPASADKVPKPFLS